jgi:hypothetical protein
MEVNGAKYTIYGFPDVFWEVRTPTIHFATNLSTLGLHVHNIGRYQWYHRRGRLIFLSEIAQSTNYIHCHQSPLRWICPRIYYFPQNLGLSVRIFEELPFHGGLIWLG